MPRIEYLFALVLVLSAVLWRRFVMSQRPPLPPGPPRRFLAGNLHQLPTSQPWLTYSEWAKEYGPIVTLRVFNRTHIILNSAKTATDLLDSRSGIYSDRPISWMSKLAGRGSAIFNLSSLDTRFPRYRKMFHSGLNRRALHAYRSTQEHQLKVLLKGLADSPDKFITLVKTYVASIALKIAYGYDVSTDNDRLVTLIEDGGRVMATINQPFFFVEILPFLRFLPSWFPFATFKRVLAASKKVLDTVDVVPFQWAKTTIESGTYAESFVSQHLHSDEGRVMKEEEVAILKWTADGIYAGGAHTTTSAIASFFLLMSTHPDIQKRAQDEIDQIVGRDRLLTLDDQRSLPYVAALLKELLRYAPVAPLGLKHRVTTDDIYNGYLIPKGSTITANIWAITHDSELYPNPSVFDPTRHLGGNPQKDPFNLVFGYGRRVCPGAALAEDSLFLAVANILATFNIYKALDGEGKEIQPDVEWRTSVVTFPLNFGCRIVLRSPEILASLGGV
ncbi:cytochrome P450 [Mycena capillaripes]|nr:cytochrome P450 [Mycena capillaripes]